MVMQIKLVVAVIGYNISTDYGAVSKFGAAHIKN